MTREFGGDLVPAPRSYGMVDLVLAARAELAEGPCWLDGELLWVDTPRGEVHWTDIRRGRDVVARFGRHLGVVVPADDGTYLAATDEGFAVIDGDRLDVHDPVAAGPGLLMNDGKCDAAGRFWASVNGSEEEPGRGTLRVWAPGRPSRLVDEGFTLLNGIGWSPDDTIMYVVDSVARRLYAYEYDLETGDAGMRETLRHFDDIPGLPDGLAVDAEGCLWVAFYAGSCLLRLAPSGRTIARIGMPVSRPTSCAFGDGTDLYVTSAREGLSADQLHSEPLAGSLWRIDAGVAGAPVAAAAPR
ncbi:SMP-30/gluconolactonase/LRE family protein [Nonomuraea antimicrobica]|uniref:SMP-30/gluconolactonase/LRE family protein n=1 Tax=Nonomuraea antimicrobica TaxID=561173 RepID=A0ABP7D2M5_9ACTN